MDVEIWHYPRCSKSRQTLELLTERCISPTIRQYRQDPPDAETLDRVLVMLDMEPRELMRRKDDAYALLNLDDDTLTRDDLIGAMIEHPSLIERPVVIADGKAALGRPPQAVLALFEDGDSSS
jgi:arsenate reductase